MLPKTDEKILESGNPQNPPDWDRLWVKLLGGDLLKRARRQPLCDTNLFDVEGTDCINLHVPKWALPKGCFLCRGSLQNGICQSCKTAFRIEGRQIRITPELQVFEQHVKVRCMRCQSNKREFLPQRIFELEGKRYAVWQCRNCKTAMLTRQKTWMKETARPECAACGSKRIALYYTTTVWACHQCGEYQTKHATSLKALQAPPVMPCETCGLQSWQYLCMHLPVYYKCKNCGSQSTLGVATKDIGSIELPRQCHACDGGELLLTLPFHRGDEELSQCPYCGSKKANVQLRSGRVMEGQCSDCTGFTSSNEESLFAVNLQCTGCGVGGIVYISCEVARQVFEQVGLRISKAL